MDLSIKLIIFTSISLIFVVLALVLAIHFGKTSKYKTTLSPMIVFAAGIFIGTCFMFYPIYELQFSDCSSFECFYKSLSLSIHNSMRLFVLDGEFDGMNEFIKTNVNNNTIASIFSIYSVTMYIVAPVSVVGVGLSFFKNLTTMIKYTISLKRNFYYLSNLNERSLLLAKNILDKDKKNRQIIFFDVQSYDEESELIFKAKNLGALLFTQDINEISIKKPSSKRIVKCYFISDDEDKNLKDSLEFIKHHNKLAKYNNQNLQCYVFSRTADSGLLLDSIEKGDIKVRRVNESRNLIMGILRNNSIFENYIERNGIKEINILIVGLGRYGLGLLNAICWCGQMHGYKLTIDVVDTKNNLEDIVASQAPELIKLNNIEKVGEAYYNIRFHDNMDVLSNEFYDEIEKLKDTTTAFIMLGNDELNIKSAIRLRELFGRLNLDGKCVLPKIYATITNPEKTDILSDIGGLKNFKNQSYDINIIGDIRTEYSPEIIEQSELEEKGLRCHLFWSKTVEEKERATYLFNKYEYYRKSSMAEALYAELRKKLGILYDENNPQNNEIIKSHVHCRWNTYMRTEGYVFNKTRNDIAKTHYSLISYDDLPESEKDKDGEVLKAFDIE